MKPRQQAAPTQPTVATVREIVAGTSQGDYVPKWQPVRPGAEDALKIPSLHCGTRYYRDGREVKA